GGEVGDGGVVLVDASEQHAPGGGAGRLRQRVAPGGMGVIADLTPVEDGEDDRPAGAEQGEPVREERVIDLLRRGDTAAHQGAARGGGWGGAGGGAGRGRRGAGRRRRPGRRGRRGG